MLRAVVSGPAEKLDEAIRSLVLGMEFHPLPASEVFGRGELDAPSGDDPYRAALSAALSLLSKLGVAPEFRPFEDRGYELESCEKYISNASSEAARVITHRNAEMSLAADNEELITRLEPFSLLCDGERYQNRLLLIPGDVPRFTLRLRKGDDPLRCAQSLVEDYARVCGEAE